MVATASVGELSLSRYAPPTSVARTLVDLADVLGEKPLAAAIHEAEVHRLFDLGAVHDVLKRLPSRKGRHLLTRALSQYEPSPKILRSEENAAWSGSVKNTDCPSLKPRPP